MAEKDPTAKEAVRSREKSTLLFGMKARPEKKTKKKEKRNEDEKGHSECFFATAIIYFD